MKDIRRALVTSALALAVCGLASAGTITQTFSLPGGSTATGWTAANSTGVQAYDYLQSFCIATCGTLSNVTITMSWASTGTGAATDTNPGSTGSDAYTFQNDTKVSLTADGLVINLTETTAAGSGVGNTSAGNSGTGCVDSSFTGKSLGNSFTETGCLDSSVIEAASGNADGANLSQSTSSGAAYLWFEGANVVNDLTFTGKAATNGAFIGPPWNANSQGYATEAVTVVYTYATPSSVPEPTTLFLMGSALVGCGLLRKRIKS
jgi:hypothetical protein